MFWCDGKASESVLARYFDPKLGRFLTQDSFLGNHDNPPSLHRYAYGYNNPLVYIDPDGNESVRQAWGLDEPQGFWSAFGKNVAYNAWNVISLGTLGRQDTLVEQYEAGQIGDAQYWGRTAINAGSSVAIGVAAAATGGAAGVAASSLGAGAVATGAIAGAAAGIGGQAATDILEVGALQTKSFEDVSATDYLIAGGGGALFGGLAGKAYAGSRPAVSARAPARQPATTAPKATTVVESAHPPKALPAGRQPKALIGPAGDPGLTGQLAKGSGTPRFVVDPHGRAAAIEDLRALARARQAMSQPGATPHTIGVAGEDFLRQITRGGGRAQARLRAGPKLRIVDERVRRTNLEIKNTSRPQGNTRFFRRQLAKDRTLLRGPETDRSVVIGLRGFTRPARREASRAGVEVIDLTDFPDISSFPFR